MMLWPADFTTRDTVFKQVNEDAKRLKAKCAQLRTKSAAGDITAYEITIDLLPRLKAAKSLYTQAAVTAGIAAYIAGELTDGGIPTTQQEVIDAYSAMLGAVTGALSWIEENLPASGGFLAIEQITSDGSGEITPRLFNSAATAGLRTALQSVEDTIDG